MAFTQSGLNGGNTTHYSFFYDDSLSAPINPGGPEPARTLAAMRAAEADFNQMSGWFSGTALDVNFRITVNVTQRDGGAGWTLSNGNLGVTINPGTSGATHVRYLLVSEMVEQFMRAQGRGWFGQNTEGSGGEGLSRFLAAQFLAVNGLGTPRADFANSNSWLSSSRGDYVNIIKATDDGPDAITGCSLLFIYYLFSQRGFGVNAIVAAGANTLGGVYRNLTGKTDDPFPFFKRLLDNAFPGTTTITTGNLDNPFPLSEWFHGTPSAGDVAVVSGTRPTSWYTTPENVQHIAYVGTDQQIHECFYFIGGNTGWLHGIPSAGDVPVAPGTSPTSWYTTPENVQHIAYVGTDQQIHECFYFIGGNTGWLHGIPSAGDVPVAPGTSPTSWYTTPENVQHIAYVGTDQQIHECFYFIGGNTGWLHGIPSAGDVPVAPGTSPTSWYTTPENVQHIAYVGTDQQIHECFYFIGGNTGWLHGIPSAGDLPVAPGTSPTSWYTTPENVQHIAYVGTDQQIHECFYFIGGNTGWLHGIPSAGDVPVAPGTSPTSWYTTPENVQHIAYVGTDQQIHECFYLIH